MPMVVATNIINKKTYLMTFIAWAILLTDVIFGTFLDVLGKPLNSSFGVILFITMSITVFFAGLYALRDFMVALRKDLEASSFFNRLYKATPIFLYALLVVFGAITVQMVLFSHYSTYLLLLIVLISGVAILFFGFRTYKFLSWFKSSSNKRHNIMILAFAVSSLLFGISVTTTTVLDTKVFLSARPASIDPDYQSSNDIGSRQLSRIELMIHLYIYIVPVVLAIPAETVAVAYFLRYFRDQIGRATFWTLVILPPLLNIFGIFGPQLLTTGSEFVYAESRFLIFRIIGTAGWVGADFVIAFAYLLVAKTLGRQTTSSSHTKKIINYLIIAALSTILVSPTANNWITNTSYPPFGAIQRAFDVLASFLFSIGIYSVGLSLAQDSKLRHLARKYAKEYSLLDTLGNAQLDAEVTRKFVKLIHEQAGAMKKETGVEPLTDDNEIRQYLELVIRETREKKKDDRTVGR
jgi:hypothetical protein